MTDAVMKDLEMAKISLAKVPDIEKMREDAETALVNFRTSNGMKDKIQAAINDIESVASHQITTEIVTRVDDFINKEIPKIVELENGYTVAGTESFGLTLSPKEWQATRALALKNLLAETYKNIKRWANQLSEIFRNRWSDINGSIAVLRSRLENIDATLASIDTKGPANTSVKINSLIAGSISKYGIPLPFNNFAFNLNTEINFIHTIINLWIMEQTRFKNLTIKYFGNPSKFPITIIDRPIPKIFDQKSMQPDLGDSLITKSSRGLVGGKAVEVVGINPKWLIGDAIDGNEYADTLSESGWYLASPFFKKATDIVMPVLSVDDIWKVRDNVQGIIDKLAVLGNPDNPINFNPNDIKDVLSGLKNGEDKDLAYQYGVITADYQYNVNTFAASLCGYLITLASHYMTMIIDHLENYRVER